MRWPIVIAMGLLLEGNPASAGPQSAKASIEGTVVRIGSGDPIGGAQVTLIPVSLLPRTGGVFADGPVSALLPPGIPMPIAPVTTDSEGRFAVARVDPDSYRLAIRRSGYVTQELGPSIFPGQGVTIHLAEGQAMRDIVVRMTPTGSLSGRVQDTNGQPLVGIQVQLLRNSYNFVGQKATEGAIFTRTNDRGEYRLYHLTPGRYSVSAGSTTSRSGSAAFGASPNEITEPFTTTYYPGSADMGKAAMLDVQAGSELNGIDFTLSRQRLFSIRGRIIDSVTGQPPASTSFWLLTRSAMTGSFGSFGDPSSYSRGGYNYNATIGTFELRSLPPGLYGVAVGQGLDGFRTIEILNSDVDGVVITVSPKATLSGRLRVEGQELATVPGFDRIVVAFQTSMDGAPITITNVGSVRMTISSDGTLYDESIRPIEYRLSVLNLPPGFYVKEAQLGKVDLLSEPLRNLVSDSDELDIVFASDSGQIDGVVTGEALRPIEGLSVALVPDRLRSRKDRYKSAVTDREGHFRIAGIPPGDYKLYAWEAIEPFSWFDPEVLKDYELKGKSIHVPESSRLTVDLKSIPPSP